MIDQNDPLPSGERISAEERATRFQTRLVTPAANPSFAVRVMVPRTWEPLELPGADREVDAVQLTPIAGWQDPAYGTGPALFHVQAIGLPRELAANHFTVEYANEQELTILAMRAISDVLADALLAQTIQGQPYIVRMATLFDGDRAYVAMGLAHRSDYGDYADLFGAMIGSIELEHPVGRPHVEDRVTRTLLDNIAFEAPISFRALEVPDGTETHRALDLFQKDPGGEFSGQIRVDLDLECREPNARNEMVYVAAHLMQHGVTLGKDPEEIGVEAGEGPIRPTGMYRVDETSSGGAPVEVWIGLFHVSGAALRVWMIGPERRAAFRQWAVNQRGFRVLMQTLRTAS